MKVLKEYKMIISSRKKLLQDADQELKNIRFSIREDKNSYTDDLQSLSKRMNDRLNDLAKDAVEKHNVVTSDELDKQLELFRIKMEKAQREKDWRKMNRMERAIFSFERYYGKKPTTLWDKAIVNFDFLISMLPGAIRTDSQGNLYDADSGEKMTPEQLENFVNTDPITGLDRRSSGFISALLRILTLG